MYVMARPNRGFVRYNFYIDRKHLKELKMLSSFEDRNVSDLIRGIISSFLVDKNPIELTDDMKKEEGETND